MWGWQVLGAWSRGGTILDPFLDVRDLSDPVPVAQQIGQRTFFSSIIRFANFRGYATNSKIQGRKHVHRGRRGLTHLQSNFREESEAEARPSPQKTFFLI